MTQLDSVAARIAARRAGRAVLTRASRAIAADPPVTVAIATIKIVTEEHAQAVAYGSPPAPPGVVVRENPLGRATSDLQPFAIWLCGEVDRAIAGRSGFRLWLPHAATLETLAVFGRRYERNPSASPELRRAGLICRLLTEEAEHEGNQIVAVARDVLLGHLATGQMPIEDAHLGAVLAWANPPPGWTAAETAQRRAMLPAAGILPNVPERRDDDQSERLRRTIRQGNARAAAAARRELAQLLERAAKEEWTLVAEAYSVFDGLKLPPAERTAELFSEAMDRFARRLANEEASPRRAIALSKHIDEREDALARREIGDIASDPVVRERQRRAGRVVAGTVVDVHQPNPNRHPCMITIRTEQPVVRFRPDERVAAVGQSRCGHVRDVRQDPATGATAIVIQLEKGVRGAASLRGTAGEWYQANEFPQYLRKKVLNDASDRGHWLASEAQPPDPVPRSVATPGRLIDLANALRGR